MINFYVHSLYSVCTISGWTYVVINIDRKLYFYASKIIFLIYIQKIIKDLLFL
jgi:hypothetical protein